MIPLITRIFISDDMYILIDSKLCWYHPLQPINFIVDEKSIPYSICKKILGKKRYNDAEIIYRVLFETYTLYKQAFHDLDITYKEGENICRVFTPDSTYYNMAISNCFNYFSSFTELSAEDYEKVTIEVAYRIISERRKEILKNDDNYNPENVEKEIDEKMKELQRVHPEKYDTPYQSINFSPKVNVAVAIADIDGNRWIISKKDFKSVIKNKVYRSDLIRFFDTNNIKRQKYDKTKKYDYDELYLEG